MVRILSKAAILNLILLIGVNAFQIHSVSTSSRMVKPSIISSLLMSETDEAHIAVDGSKTVDRALDSALDFLADGEDEVEEEEDEFAMFDFDDTPDIEIPYDLIEKLKKNDIEFTANNGASVADANKAAILDSVKKWQRHDKDVGSSEVQVAIAHERIKYLTAHLIANKKDMSTKRGLQALVVRRKKHMANLYKRDPVKARQMIEELGIRFRDTTQNWDKEIKYGACKNTKSKWQKIRADKRAYAGSRSEA